MKKIFYLIIILFLVVFISGCNKKDDNVNIVATNFPCYDFIRAIVGSDGVKMLLKPGVETHDFEPTPKDIIDIKNSSMFIYVGGESDTWVDEILKNVDTEKTKVVKLMDLVDLELEPGEEDEYDEHVWTSPVNAIKIVNKLKDIIINIDSYNKDKYEKNALSYIDKLKDIDAKIREVVNNSKRKELIFADRFPLIYFVKEYGLTYYAAFSGCAHETEVSAKTLSFLIDKVKTDNIPVILHIELSNKKIAEQISKETNTKILEFNSSHNISKDNYLNGMTYVDIYYKNIDVLKEALN